MRREDPLFPAAGNRDPGPRADVGAPCDLPADHRSRRTGGGFAGGLIAAAAILLIFLTFGVHGVRRAIPADPEIIVGVGLAVAIGAGVLGSIFHGTFLTATYASATVPIIGDVKLSSLLLFDVGVFLLVVGLVTSALVRLGAEQS